MILSIFYDPEKLSELPVNPEGLYFDNSQNNALIIEHAWIKFNDSKGRKGTLWTADCESFFGRDEETGLLRADYVDPSFVYNLSSAYLPLTPRVCDGLAVTSARLYDTMLGKSIWAPGSCFVKVTCAADNSRADLLREVYEADKHRKRYFQPSDSNRLGDIEERRKKCVLAGYNAAIRDSRIPFWIAAADCLPDGCDDKTAEPIKHTCVCCDANGHHGTAEYRYNPYGVNPWYTTDARLDINTIEFWHEIPTHPVNSLCAF